MLESVALKVNSWGREYNTFLDLIYVHGKATDLTCRCARAFLRRPTVYGDQGRQIESTQAESQWIVEQVYSQHLQYLEAIKSSAKDLSLPIFKITIYLTVRMKLGRSL